MNTPPEEAKEPEQMIRLLNRLLETKVEQLSGNEAKLSASWELLLHQIQDEIRSVSQTGSKNIPEIGFHDIRSIDKADSFLRDLTTRGAVIIRNVVSVNEAEAWSFELDSYLRDNPHTKASPAEDPDLYELFWSLAQLNARAHPNMLEAQKFAMSGCWHHPSSTLQKPLSCKFPVTYADRVRMRHKSLRGSSPGICKAKPSVLPGTRIGGGGCGPWEVDNDGPDSSTSVYREIWSGNWEDYDPWDTSSRLDREMHLDKGLSTSGVVKLFQGMLPLSLGSSDDDSQMRVCSLPLKLTTAYCLLRPFFSPKRPFTDNRDDYLHPSNWAMDIAQSSVNRASHDISDTTHPHLQLEKTLVSLPPLHPGDYVIWHPDTIHSTLNTRPQLESPSSPQEASCSPGIRATSPSPSTILYIPACPLTQSNAEYLVHQRKAFLLGFPGPDFISTQGGGHADFGESYHMGRPGVQEINDAGGEDALRAMGLLAWEEDDAADAGERDLLRRANALLFPDRAGARFCV
ncbi:hypothetical protein N0V93_001768 [Gnomoniopsis smithogilvyi]|uniref:DUF1479-domain-containing protein n=1 Tax=Gnomoniopsis smithogilvyi TaxID=1191159 RepID=A0A9W8Z2A4_9PEZI|nr:hypothetical protein N0V93_001768 [Gnomoniopsis smithogilvyi]